MNDQHTEWKNLFELRQGLSLDVKLAAEKYAYSKAREWPYGTYSPNDLTTMYEHGYLTGYIEAMKAGMNGESNK